MIIRITKGGITSIQEVDPLPNNLYRVKQTGLILDPDTYNAGVEIIEDILEITNLKEIDEVLGEVMVYAIRHRNK